jgi:hypothetical protein
MSITFTSGLSKPSGVIVKPGNLERPEFGTLYGFDAEDDGGGVVPTAYNITTRDTEANISASTPTNPSGEVTIAYGTDTEDLYVWDGSSWYVYNNV